MVLFCFSFLSFKSLLDDILSSRKNRLDKKNSKTKKILAGRIYFLRYFIHSKHSRLSVPYLFLTAHRSVRSWHCGWSKAIKSQSALCLLFNKNTTIMIISKIIHNITIIFQEVFTGCPSISFSKTSASSLTEEAPLTSPAGTKLSAGC